jgi:hypothetical protein
VRTATKYLGLLCVFGLVLGAVYWFLTHEWTGAVLLWFLGLMPLIVGAYAARHGSLRGPPAQEQDDPEATPGEAAGEVVGSFPMGSVWPIFLVLGVLLTGAGVVYGLILVPAGLAVMGWAVIGLMRESRG